MNTVHVLIANSDRRLNNLIEVAVRDVCYEQVLVECIFTSRLDEVKHRGSSDIVRLIFLAPNHVVIGPPHRAASASLEDSTLCIQAIRTRRSIPIIAVGMAPGDEIPLLEAGADSVFGILFDGDKLRSQIRQGLGIPEQVAESEPLPRWSFASGLLRSFQKLRQN
jgi:hypothetical protein